MHVKMVKWVGGGGRCGGGGLSCWKHAKIYLLKLFSCKTLWFIGDNDWNNGKELNKP